jgi:hypothetical protein
VSKNVRPAPDFSQAPPGGNFDNRKRKIKYLTSINWNDYPDECIAKIADLVGMYRGKGGKPPAASAGAATPFSERSGRPSQARRNELLAATPLGKQILADRRGKK